MNSLILQTTTRLLVSLMLLFSIFVLLRGHNDPGGGFIGGLIAASAFAIHAIAFGAGAARRALRADPRAIAGCGLFVAAVSGLPALVLGQPYMTGLWWFPDLGEVGKLPFGTPVLFDIGVYLVVVGAVACLALTLEEPD